MSPTGVERASAARAAAPAHGGSRIRQRQRQRLIDACISALHLHGPSRTTIEKVVALADLSPGIVRFYFDSKAALLVAALEHLAAEFQQRVMDPVALLKDEPVQALRRLVELYLDADIASPRKVSVWYSFWGEASSRQEYLQICGKKDDDFAALVRELIERLIVLEGATHLDADGVALGLIGVLEVLWQGIAFQSEARLDRSAALGRSLAFLRSVFPGRFAAYRATKPPAPGDPTEWCGRLPAGAYADETLLAAERERLLRPAWQVFGHEAELLVAGDYLTGDLAGGRGVVVRAERGRLHAFRNACRRRPHALLGARRGHLESAIHCGAHGLTYAFDGHLVAGGTPGDLIPLALMQRGPMLLVRACLAAEELPAPPGATAWNACATLLPGPVTELEVAANWKLIVEQWLETPQAERVFVAPNQLLETRREGALVLQVLPIAAGRSRVRCFEFLTPGARGGRATPERTPRRGAARGAARDAARRGVVRSRPARWLREQAALAESTQVGLLGLSAEPLEAGPVNPALAHFRALIVALLHPRPAA